jgi:hypothetical protein
LALSFSNARQFEYLVPVLAEAQAHPDPLGRSSKYGKTAELGQPFSLKENDRKL